MPIASASSPPASGPTAADRICAAWIRPTARPVSSRGACAVAMARPSGPMPPKRPMPMRSDEQLLDARHRGATAPGSPRTRRAPSPRCPCGRGGRRAGPTPGARSPARSGATPIRTPAHSAAAPGSFTPSSRTKSGRNGQHEGEAREDGEHHRHGHELVAPGDRWGRGHDSSQHLADGQRAADARAACALRPLEPQRAGDLGGAAAEPHRGRRPERDHHVAPAHALAPAGAERLAGRLLRRDRERQRGRALGGRRRQRGPPPGSISLPTKRSPKRSSARSTRAVSTRSRPIPISTGAACPSDRTIARRALPAGRPGGGDAAHARTDL